MEHERRKELILGQNPFAIILGCSDSRVPAELVFDQGIGDLFVIRVAGNIVAPSLIGSVEYAVEMFGTSLVVVLGHTNCGAVIATLNESEQSTENRSPNLRSIVDRIRPTIAEFLDPEISLNRSDLLSHAIRANIRASVSQLQHGSEILERMVLNSGLLIVGAEYSLETGLVDFFEGLPK